MSLRPRCGCRTKAYATKAGAERALQKIQDLGLRKAPPKRIVLCGQAQWHLVGAQPTRSGPDRDTKALVMERDEWRCACCGTPVRGREYSRQHRVARGSGGTRRLVINSPANLVLLCGSATTPDRCHARAEQRDPDMYAAGFWLHAVEDPLTVPVRHAVHGLILLNMAGGWTPAPAKAGAR